MKAYTVTLDEELVKESREKAKRAKLSFSAYIRLALIEKNKRR